MTIKPFSRNYPKIKGILKYEHNHVDSFVATLSARNCKPNHRYILSLCGYVKHGSNSILKECCEEYEATGEGNCDFMEVFSDGEGNLEVPNIVKKLPKSKKQ